MLEIVTDPILLRQPCSPVKQNERLQYSSIIAEMRRFVSENNGLGLAAPQVGIQKSFFVFLVKSGSVLTVFNPKIEVLTDETIEFTERCFSCPGIDMVTHRPRKVRMMYHNPLWNMKSQIFEDELAVIAQHETDHLRGKLISDYNE